MGFSTSAVVMILTASLMYMAAIFYPQADMSYHRILKAEKNFNERQNASHAGTTSKYFFGDNESMLGDYAWYDYNSGNKTHEIGKKKPNPWVYTTCTAMSVNGCRIYITVAITARQLMEVHGKELARTASFGAVAGSTTPKAAGRQFTATAIPTPATISSAFAF